VNVTSGIYLLVGALAGTLAGLLGVGGGLVIVPALVWAFRDAGFPEQAIMHLAVGTSLATIVFTSASSVRAHQRRGAVRWDLMRRLAPGVVVGVLGGAALAGVLSTRSLAVVFGLLEVLIAAYMAWGGRSRAGTGAPGPAGMRLAGCGIGLVSGLAGIAGGTMSVPLLVWWQTPIHAAVATSAAVGFPIAVAGTLGFVVTGWTADLPPWSLGYVYLPALLGIAATSVLFAPLGATLAHRLRTGVLRRVFAVFLALVGIRMLVGW
jgi:hypothetical protein